jgi:hypothetical protein
MNAIDFKDCNGVVTGNGINLIIAENGIVKIVLEVLSTRQITAKDFMEFLIAKKEV